MICRLFRVDTRHVQAESLFKCGVTKGWSLSSGLEFTDALGNMKNTDLQIDGIYVRRWHAQFSSGSGCQNPTSQKLPARLSARVCLTRFRRMAYVIYQAH